MSLSDWNVSAIKRTLTPHLPTKADVRRAIDVLEIASIAIPSVGAVGAGAKAIRGGASVAARASNKASQVAMKAARKKAAAAGKTAARNGSIRLEEYLGNSAIRSAQRSVKFAENARVLSRASVKAGKTANKVDALPLMGPEWKRFRTALALGAVYIESDKNGRPIRIMF